MPAVTTSKSHASPLGWRIRDCLRRPNSTGWGRHDGYLLSATTCRRLSEHTAYLPINQTPLPEEMGTLLQVGEIGTEEKWTACTASGKRQAGKIPHSGDGSGGLAAVEDLYRCRPSRFEARQPGPVDRSTNVFACRVITPCRSLSEQDDICILARINA